jgi:integrase
LRSFFVSVFAPTYLTAAKPKTHHAYAEAVAHWTRITGDPPLGAIRVETLARFKADLLTGACAQPPLRQLTLFDAGPHEAKGLARATVNKHLRAVFALLSKAGPPGPRNRDALGLLQSTPWVKPLREPKRLPRAIRADDVVVAYEACDTARFPHLEGVHAGYWWKAILVTAYTAAFRRGGLLALRWRDVDLVAETIHLDADDDKCLCERVKPLHHVVVLHLLRIRTRSELVFPWPHSERTFYRQWHEIQENAGIPRPRHFGLHDLKRTAGTIYAGTSSPWAVQTMLDHSNIATSMRYVNPAEKLRPAVDAFPLPLQICADVGADPRRTNQHQAT